jgi:DNA-binding MarR family transcriptional regulator
VTARPDPFIHPITRLSICGLLAAGGDWVEFAALRDAAGISDSVLSKQSVALEEAGYVQVRKGAVGRRPRTWFRLTAKGRHALESHLAWLAQLEQAVSVGSPDVTHVAANSVNGRTAPRTVPSPD